MKWNKHWLADPDFKSTYGTLYTDIRVDGKEDAMYWTGFHCLRRLVFAMTIAWLGNNLIMKIELLTFSSLAMTAYVFSVMPMTSMSHNFNSCLSECIVLLACYYILAFSTYNLDYGSRITYGWIYLGIIGFALVMNVSVTVYQLVSQLCSYCKKRRRKKAYEKVLAKIKEL